MIGYDLVIRDLHVNDSQAFISFLYKTLSSLQGTIGWAPIDICSFFQPLELEKYVIARAEEATVKPHARVYILSYVGVRNSELISPSTLQFNQGTLLGTHYRRTGLRYLDIRTSCNRAGTDGPTGTDDASLMLSLSALVLL